MTSLAETGSGSMARNVGLLSLCQGLWLCIAGVSVTLTGIVGGQLARDPSQATVPYALLGFATALSAAPASFLMSRIGRGPGFVLGAIAGTLGAGLSALAITLSSFALFCVGAVLIGLFQAFTLYYRFAAVEAAPPGKGPRAISLVLVGGVLAAFAGPVVTGIGRDLLAPWLFAGSFAIAAGAAALSALAAGRLRLPKPSGIAIGPGSGRPIGVITRQPAFVVGVLGAVTAYAVMAFVMTATPIAMLGCGLDTNDAAQVIQWHILGMFAPAFVTGSLITRFGVGPIVLAGLALLCVSALVGLTGLEAWRFSAALVLLGVGWNFAYVGSTALLAGACAPVERAKTQAASEAITFSAAALAAMLAGPVHAWGGWSAINLALAPLVIVTLVVTLARLARGRRVATASSPRAVRTSPPP